MIQTITPEKLIELRRSIPTVDVRTPAEFENGHIPDAFNVPLLSNEERVLIGTLYKQVSKEAAMDKGLELIGPKSASLVDTLKKLIPQRELILHCWRGGMRSGSLAWLLNLFGFKVYLLEGGYKAYRQFLANLLNGDLKLIVIGGYTGSGKTEILQALAEHGEQILDLELLANHRGSAFGSFGLGEQPPNEQFVNNLLEELYKLDLTKSIWVEDESLSIGKVYLPNELYQLMATAPRVFVNIPRSSRAKFLRDTYGKMPVEEVNAVISRIQKRMGGQNVLEARQAIEDDDKQKVIELLLNYYDKSYLHSLSRKPNLPVMELDSEMVDAPRIALELIKWRIKWKAAI